MASSIAEAIEKAAPQLAAALQRFPRRPLLDRVILREVPIAEVYQVNNLELPLDDARRKDRTDRGIVVAIGSKVQETKVGDTVFFEETALTDPVYLMPSDKMRHDLPRYWQIREPDLKGIAQ